MATKQAHDSTERHLPCQKLHYKHSRHIIEPCRDHPSQTYTLYCMQWSGHEADVHVSSAVAPGSLRTTKAARLGPREGQ